MNQFLDLLLKLGEHDRMICTFENQILYSVLDSRENGQVLAHFKLRKHHLNGYGKMHGAVISYIIDIAGSFSISAQTKDLYSGTTINLSSCCLNSADPEKDEILIYSTCDKRGKTLAFTSIFIYRIEKKPAASSSNIMNLDWFHRNRSDLGARDDGRGLVATGSHVKHIAKGYEIRQATKSEWKDIVLAWAKDLDWNPCLGDIESAMQSDVEGKGTFVATLHGKVIASIAAIRYGSDKGYLGLYVVDPIHRGKGFGLPLFKFVLETHLKGRLVALDAVENRIKDYSKLGFSLKRWMHRFIVDFDSLFASNGKGSEEKPHKFGIADMDCNTDEVIGLEAKVTGLCRSKPFVKSFINQTGLKKLVCRDSEGVLCGFIAIRPADKGFRIGPLYAQDPSMAIALLCEIYSQFGENDKNAPFYIDVNDANQPWMSLIDQTFKWEKVVSLGRMWNDEQTSETGETALNIFGQWTIEMG